MSLKPDIPSPGLTDDGREIVVCRSKDGTYLIFDITVENGDMLNVKESLYGKGLQCKVDADDFPSLAKNGLHYESELVRLTSITGKPIAEITAIARPMGYSRAGFMAADEDIISVLKGDNRLVQTLGLMHPQTAAPLFHVWNIILAGISQGIWINEQFPVDYLLYNSHKIYLKWQGRGWQESIFNDEILGQYHLEMERELDPDEKAFLGDKYSELPKDEMADFIRKLSYIHTGEMVPYYTMRYGFYEGHTDFRADPIAIAFIFGLRSIEEIENSFNGKLYQVLTTTFSM
ncbi:MAG: hypothetical protein JXB48_24350 [Candidatus Latescibacteria bacterium]|nr:hypothetical protein [Candidatus Latescibacterota bacterium]